MELCGRKKRDPGGSLDLCEPKVCVGGVESSFVPPLPGKWGRELPLATPCSYAYVVWKGYYTTNGTHTRCKEKAFSNSPPYTYPLQLCVCVCVCVCVHVCTCVCRARQVVCMFRIRCPKCKCHTQQPMAMAIPKQRRNHDVIHCKDSDATKRAMGPYKTHFW